LILLVLEAQAGSKRRRQILRNKYKKNTKFF
jgi:hypothetical protein